MSIVSNKTISAEGRPLKVIKMSYMPLESLIKKAGIIDKNQSIKYFEDSLIDAVKGYRSLDERVQDPKERNILKQDIEEKISAVYDKMYDSLENNPPESAQAVKDALRQAYQEVTALSQSLQSDQDSLDLVLLKETAHQALEDYKKQVESGVISANEISKGVEAGAMSSEYVSILERELESCHNFLRTELEQSGQGDYSELSPSAKRNIMNNYIDITQEISGHILSIECPNLFNTYDLIKQDIDGLVAGSSKSGNIRFIADIVTIQKELADFIDDYRDFSGNTVARREFLCEKLEAIKREYEEKIGYPDSLDVPSGITGPTQTTRESSSSSLYSHVSSLTVGSRNNSNKA